MSPRHRRKSGGKTFSMSVNRLDSYPVRFEPGMDEVISVRWTQEHPVHNGNESSTPHFDDEDMLGPETNVDEPVEEVGMVAKAKALVDQAKSMEGWVKERKLGNSETQWLQTLPWSYAQIVMKNCEKDGSSGENARDEVPDSPESEVKTADEKSDKSPEISDKENKVKAEENDVADGESEEDSEEEWNYTPGKENKDPSQNAEEEDDMSQLNPNAAEFVPVFTSVKETLLASSPAKGSERSLENVSVPTLDDFLTDISHKPCDTSLVEEKDEKDDAADSTLVSTKAELGDDSLMAFNLSDVKEEKLNETNPFAEDKIQDDMVQDHFGTDLKFDIDPMQQSFMKTPEEEVKPDLISQNEQQTSSSGFDSESGNEEPDLTNEKCDLVAEIHAEGEKNPFITDEGAVLESTIPSPVTNGPVEESPLVEAFTNHFSAPQENETISTQVGETFTNFSAPQENVPDFLESIVQSKDSPKEDSQGESDFEMINPTENELKEMNGLEETKTDIEGLQEPFSNHIATEIIDIQGISPMDFLKQYHHQQENIVNNEVDDLIGNFGSVEPEKHQNEPEAETKPQDLLIEPLQPEIEVHIEQPEPVHKTEPEEPSQEIPEEIKPLECSNVDVETLQKVETVVTPPPTPAPGPVEEDKDTLIAAAFAAAGAAVAAGVVAEAVLDEKPEEKVKEEEKPKEEKEEVKKAAKPAAKTSPAKTTATKTAAKPAPAAAKKPATTLTKAAASTTTKPAARPASSTTRPTSAAKPAPKPSTPVTKVAPKPASKPTTPITKTAAKPAPKPASPITKAPIKEVKPAPKPITKPPVKTEIKKTEVKPITRPTSATSTTSRPSSASSTTARPLPKAAPKTAASTLKPAPKPASTLKTTLTKTTTAAKPAPKPAAPIKAPIKAPLTKPAPKPAVTSTTKPVTKPAVAPASKVAPKTKAAPTALKKPLNDKTVKETANKLAKKEEPKIDQAQQEPIVTTTNGHNGLIENGHHETVEV